MQCVKWAHSIEAGMRENASELRAYVSKQKKKKQNILIWIKLTLGYSFQTHTKQNIT